MALARDARGGDETVLVVIGDGSLTGGMAFEALNHIGHLGTRIVIVLNDNEMSISENVGALASYLARVRLDPRYQRLRDEVESRLSTTPLGKGMVDAGEAVKESVKQLLLKPGMFFEELGLKYVGPIDGHDVDQVEQAVARAKADDGPVIIHAVTTKGAGYEHAEAQPDAFHGIGPFSVDTGETNGSGGVISYTAAFSKALIAEAAADDRIVAITAAMPNGTGLDKFAEVYPERFYDVGIAEEHAVGMAAGLALGGRIPVVAIYSTFLQRAYDQMILDVALQDLHVVICLDRAGVVGEDGPTHHGVFDLTYLRSIPNMTVLAPADEVELAQALRTAIAAPGPVAIRYPRGSGVGRQPDPVPQSWAPATAELRRVGRDVAILAVGRMVAVAQEAAEVLEADGVSASVINARWIKPVDGNAILGAASAHRLLVTLEESTCMGGYGSAVCEVLADEGVLIPVERIAIPDCFVPHGAMPLLLEDLGLTPDGVASRVLERMARLDA
jgi:1-deoxy-D-xylulose-5-phosphate synthase